MTRRSNAWQEVEGPLPEHVSQLGRPLPNPDGVVSRPHLPGRHVLGQQCLLGRHHHVLGQQRLLGRHHHVLGQPRLLGRPRSLARHSLPSRAPLLTRHPPRRPVILRRVGNLSCTSLPSRHPAGPVTLWRRPVSWSRAVRSGVPHPSKIGHVVPPSCFVDRQLTTFHTSRNKRRFMSNVTWKNAHSCDRLTSEVSSHQLTSFLASKNAWERPLGQCVSDSHSYTSEAKIEVNDRWIQCSAQVLLRTERKGDSISLFEISPGIGWRADCMQPLLRRS